MADRDIPTRQTFQAPCSICQMISTQSSLKTHQVVWAFCLKVLLSERVNDIILVMCIVTYVDPVPQAPSTPQSCIPRL
jgi:hypothetical protein